MKYGMQTMGLLGWFMIFTLIMAAPASAERWLHVGGEDIFLAWSDYYVDSDSVKREGDVIRFRYRDDMKASPDAKDVFKSVLYLISMHCSEEITTILEMSDGGSEALQLNTPYRVGYLVKPSVHRYLCEGS